MRLRLRRGPSAAWLCLLALVACREGGIRPFPGDAGDDGGREVLPPTAGNGPGILPPAAAGSGGAAPSGGTPGTAGSPASRAGTGGSSPSSPPSGPAPAPVPAPTLVGDVKFSVPSQTFRDRLEVSLSTAITGAEIRYTTDGTLPTASSPVYTDKLQLSATTRVRAQAFVNGMPNGNVSTSIYIARTFDATSDLPIVVIDGYGGAKPTDTNVYKEAGFLVFEPNEGQASLAGIPTIASRAGYHVRGQSSSKAPQTPYRVELRNNADEDEDYALLGMPADSDWALIPPYYDRALVRNPLVYQLGRDIGLAAPRVRFAEVYINYEGRPLAATDYQGVYWVTETIKNNRDRLDLQQLEPEDVAPELLSGGYIFKFDQAAAEEPKIACTGSQPTSGGGVGQPVMMGGGNSGTMRGTCWTDLEVVDPEPLAPEQAAWFKNYVQTFHNSLHENPIGDYAADIEVGSFVDYLIINELTRNVDAYVRSAYYHKDRGGKLVAGPLWDYNFSLGVGGMGTIDPTGGWQYQGTRNVNNWYPKLTSDPAFMNRVKARWVELRGGPLADAAIEKRIDELVTPLKSAAERDYGKWKVADILKPGAFVRGPSDPTWDGQVQALRTFVRGRTAWMDSQLR